MSRFQDAYTTMLDAMDCPGIRIPASAVTFYSHDQMIPAPVMAYCPDTVTVTSCQAARSAMLGDAVLLTAESIGCVAAAITFGLVDQDQDTPLQGNRIYTDLMREQSEDAEAFAPPSPADFTTGLVYACRDAGRDDFCLFGPDDTGRFKDVATARKAISEMAAIQPATTKGVFFFSPDFDEIDLEPDVVVMSLRPVELTRVIQAYQYMTGERVTADMGPLRVVNSDLIVKPYQQQRINISTYCLGARLIGRFEGDRLGIGMPFESFEITARGMEASRTGYPFSSYPGACTQGFD